MRPPWMETERFGRVLDWTIDALVKPAEPGARERAANLSSTIILAAASAVMLRGGDVVNGIASIEGQPLVAARLARA